jgi:transcriptional regulator with PAS, ATPase and Fis domain
MVAQRSFREDLYYRLSAMTVTLPPLRQRPEDIAALSEHFLSEASRMFHRRWRELSRESVGLLSRYPWPGNVREMRAVIHRAALLHDEEVLRPEHLPPEIVGAALRAEDPMPVPGAGKAAIPTMAEVELWHIRRVLDLCGGNRTLAAQHLGITRQTLAKKLGPTPEGEE